MKEAEYNRMTYELTIYVAKILLEVNTGMTFCYVSGDFENMVTNTQTLGKAMIMVASKGFEKKILESRDINNIVKR